MKATVAQFVEQLNHSQYWSLPKIAGLQTHGLKQVVQHHAEHTPYFINRLAAHGLTPDDVSTLAGLKRLPPFKKRHIQEVKKDFFAQHVPPTHMPLGMAQSSGSTGEPVTIRKTRLNDIFWHAYTIRDHEWYGRDYTGRLTAVRAIIPNYVETDQWGGPVSMLYTSGPAQGIPVTTDIKQQIAWLNEFQPNIIIVHAGVMRGYVEEWRRNRYALTELKHIKNVGDTVSELLRTHVREITGLEMEDNYSSSEVGAIAIQCPVSGLYHVMSESLIVEILDEQGNDCAQGEIGRVVITDLYNMASPIIRYDIGDYAEVGAACTCGRRLPTLKRVLGRERGLLVRPDGTRFWPMAGQYTIADLFNVRQWQIIQHSLDDIEYKFVTDHPFTAEQEMELRALINQRLGYPGTVRVSWQAEYIPTNQGKFEETICLIPQP